MTYLVLGAKGNLGSQFIKILGESAIGLDRQDVNLLDFKELENKLSELSFDIIINAAAYNAVDKCEGDLQEKSLAFQLNESLPDFLAKYSLAHNKVLVHYSTDYVFSGTLKEGYDENMEPDPINVYGQSKLAGEVAIKAQVNKGLKAYIIRTSKLFGPQGSSPLTKVSFFDLMLGLAKEKQELEVVDSEKSAFTYTVDLASKTLELIENYPTGLYHLVNSNAATWFEAAKEMFDILAISIKVKPVSAQAFARPAPRPEYSQLLNTKGPSMRSWQEALKDYLLHKTV